MSLAISLSFVYLFISTLYNNYRIYKLENDMIATLEILKIISTDMYDMPEDEDIKE